SASFRSEPFAGQGVVSERNGDSPDRDSHITLRAMRVRTTLTTVSLALSLAASGSAQTPQAARRTPVVAVVEKVAPAVVNISAQSPVREADPFFGMFGLG